MKIIEFYAGIGGYRFALNNAKICYDSCLPIEINNNLISIYEHNLDGSKVLNTNINGMTVNDIKDVDLFSMSPPCQPFCRTGLTLDDKDNRSSSFLHLLSLFPQLNFKYIIIENVKGFEESEVRTKLIEVLKEINFEYEEFLLSPIDFGIPNSRLRYYLLGRKSNQDQSSPFRFSSSGSIQINIDKFTTHPNLINIFKEENKIWNARRLRRTLNNNHDVEINCISDILDDLSESEKKKYLVPEKVQNKHLGVMDIVTPSSTRSCCFTKGYGHFVKATGSILKEKSQNDIDTLRYFTPKEISRLLCYPESFSFPDNVSIKQQYKALGNSLNIHIVSILLTILLPINS